MLENAQAFSSALSYLVPSASVTWEGFFDARYIGFDKRPSSALSELSFTSKTPPLDMVVPSDASRELFGYGFMGDIFLPDSEVTR